MARRKGFDAHWFSGDWLTWDDETAPVADETDPAADESLRPVRVQILARTLVVIRGVKRVAS